MTLVRDPNDITLAMAGMKPPNYHPYSWSAILNGYDPGEMAKCPAPRIPTYLGCEPTQNFPIPGVRVTHIYTDDPAYALHVSKAALIPHVVARPEDLIGRVDAVLIPTDVGHEHVERCRPFVEAELPIFVDKPLVDNEADLQLFSRWVREGRAIMSSSCLRYCKEFMPYRASIHNLGRVAFATITMSQRWEQYGIHALEGIYPIFGSGFLSAQNLGTTEQNVVHYKHRCGTDIVVAVTRDMEGADGVLQLCGSLGTVHAQFSDYFYAFKAQLEAFISYLRTGVRPFPFGETEELMKMVIGADLSLREGRREVQLDEITT